MLLMSRRRQVVCPVMILFVIERLFKTGPEQCDNTGPVQKSPGQALEICLNMQASPVSEQSPFRMITREDNRSVPRRQPAELRRKSLVAAAMRCLAYKGAEGTSIRSIAAEAGVSVGLISHYYSGKEALVADVYEQVAGDLLQSLQKAVEAIQSQDARQR